MENYRELKKMLQFELDKITRKGDLSPNELENATKVVCLLEKLAKLEESEMAMDGGYSERGYSRTMPPYHMPPTSFAGDSYQHRDSMGRYSAGSGYEMNSQASYNRDIGYSGDPVKYHTLNRLKMMWEEAKDPHEKSVISEAIEKLER